MPTRIRRTVTPPSSAPPSPLPSTRSISPPPPPAPRRGSTTRLSRPTSIPTSSTSSHRRGEAAAPSSVEEGNWHSRANFVSRRSPTKTDTSRDQVAPEEGGKEVHLNHYGVAHDDVASASKSMEHFGNHEARLEDEEKKAQEEDMELLRVDAIPTPLAATTATTTAAANMGPPMGAAAGAQHHHHKKKKNGNNTSVKTCLPRGSHAPPPQQQEPPHNKQEEEEDAELLQLSQNLFLAPPATEDDASVVQTNGVVTYDGDHSSSSSSLPSLLFGKRPATPPTPPSPLLSSPMVIHKASSPYANRHQESWSSGVSSSSSSDSSDSSAVRKQLSGRQSKQQEDVFRDEYNDGTDGTGGGAAASKFVSWWKWRTSARDKANAAVDLSNLNQLQRLEKRRKREETKKKKKLQTTADSVASQDVSPQGRRRREEHQSSRFSFRFGTNPNKGEASSSSSSALEHAKNEWQSSQGPARDDEDDNGVGDLSSPAEAPVPTQDCASAAASAEFNNKQRFLPEEPSDDGHHVAPDYTCGEVLLCRSNVPLRTRFLYMVSMALVILVLLSILTFVRTKQQQDEAAILGLAPVTPTATPTLWPTPALSSSSAEDSHSTVPTTAATATMAISASQRLPCIVVLTPEEEPLAGVSNQTADRTAQTNALNDAWDQFRRDYPHRPFCLLRAHWQVVDENSGGRPLPLPRGLVQEAAAASNLTRWIDVVPDYGNPNLASDWFRSCGLDVESQFVALVEPSQPFEVEASRAQLQAQLQAAQVQLLSLSLDNNDDDNDTTKKKKRRSSPPTWMTPLLQPLPAMKRAQAEKEQEENDDDGGVVDTACIAVIAESSMPPRQVRALWFNLTSRGRALFCLLQPVFAAVGRNRTHEWSDVYRPFTAQQARSRLIRRDDNRTERAVDWLDKCHLTLFWRDIRVFVDPRLPPWRVEASRRLLWQRVADHNQGGGAGEPFVATVIHQVPAVPNDTVGDWISPFLQWDK